MRSNNISTNKTEVFWLPKSYRQGRRNDFYLGGVRYYRKKFLGNFLIPTFFKCFSRVLGNSLSILEILTIHIYSVYFSNASSTYPEFTTIDIDFKSIFICSFPATWSSNKQWWERDGTLNVKKLLAKVHTYIIYRYPHFNPHCIKTSDKSLLHA